MGVDSIYKGVYIVCVHSEWEPYGRMVTDYKTEEEAQGHIKFQKEHMGSTAHWNILHIKDMEWISYNK